MTSGGGPSAVAPSPSAARRATGRDAGASWLSTHSRRVRLRRYAAAMGWDLTTSGVLVGDLEGVVVRAYEDRGRTTVIEVVAPGALPRMEMVEIDRHVTQVGDGMRDVHIGDTAFESRYVIRAAEPWFARAVIDPVVRRALLAAPTQTWLTRDDRIVGRSASKLEPLDLFARATALRTIVSAVPWEAYTDRTTTPSLEQLQAVMSERRSRPIEFLPSMPRHA
jgi:hypothetical protein